MVAQIQVKLQTMQSEAQVQKEESRQQIIKTQTDLKTMGLNFERLKEDVKLVNQQRQLNPIQPAKCDFNHQAKRDIEESINKIANDIVDKRMKDFEKISVARAPAQMPV